MGADVTDGVIFAVIGTHESDFYEFTCVVIEFEFQRFTRFEIVAGTYYGRSFAGAILD